MGPHLQGAGPLWGGYRPGSLRSRMVRYRKGTEKDSCLPLPLSSVLHSCPCPLFPLSPARTLLTSQASSSKANKKSTHARSLLLWGLVTDHGPRTGRHTLMSPGGSQQPTQGHFCGREGISTLREQDNGLVDSRLLAAGTGRLSFLLHQFFSGTKQKSITAHLKFTALPTSKFNF